MKLKSCSVSSVPTKISNLSFFTVEGGPLQEGGPAAKAILAQPSGLGSGKIRITEQGEILSSRYQRKAIARRVLGQMIYGLILGAVHAEKKAPKKATWVSAMEEMSRHAQRAYESFVKENPDSLKLWNAITPIEFIKDLKIGSRPSSRRKTDSVQDLRAIPWVFSWLQTRVVLPGWFGLGSALSEFSDLKILKEMYNKWSFFRTLIDNVQMSMAKCDLGIASQYLELSNLENKEELFEIFKIEFQKARAGILKITGFRELLDAEKVLQTSIRLRNPYVDPLNYIQIEMLKRFRQSKDDQEREEAKKVIHLSIAGIAAGLKNTG